MRNFDYKLPASLDELTDMLNHDEHTARLLAGGTDLVVAMRAGRITPEVVIDTKRVEEMNELSFNDHTMILGASVTCRTVCRNPQVIKNFPALIDCATLIGGTQIQNRATLGGNLCNAAPSADTIPTLIVLKAQAHICGPHGSRHVPVEEFCTGPGQTILEPNEILVSFSIPLPHENEGAFFIRFIPRNDMDIAIANAAASIVIDNSGETIIEGRVAIGSVAPTPLYVSDVEPVLSGRPITDEVIAQAADIARQAARPITDMRGTVDQRKHLTHVLVRRALKGAVNRARGTHS
ncbi:MAG: xanthine dehydrogenase family protein subunit M [Arenicellales bacterium]|nr:xanthine dehydrogenase family protein subunit M [Arenicellales bacterium]